MNAKTGRDAKMVLSSIKWRNSNEHSDFSVSDWTRAQRNILLYISLETSWHVNYIITILKVWIWMRSFKSRHFPWFFDVSIGLCAVSCHLCGPTARSCLIRRILFRSCFPWRTDFRLLRIFLRCCCFSSWWPAAATGGSCDSCPISCRLRLCLSVGEEVDEGGDSGEQRLLQLAQLLQSGLETNVGKWLTFLICI